MGSISQDDSRRVAVGQRSDGGVETRFPHLLSSGRFLSEPGLAKRFAAAAGSVRWVGQAHRSSCALETRFPRERQEGVQTTYFDCDQSASKAMPSSTVLARPHGSQMSRSLRTQALGVESSKEGIRGPFSDMKGELIRLVLADRGVCALAKAGRTRAHPHAHTGFGHRLEERAIDQLRRASLFISGNGAPAFPSRRCKMSSPPFGVSRSPLVETRFPRFRSPQNV